MEKKTAVEGETRTSLRQSTYNSNGSPQVNGVLQSNGKSRSRSRSRKTLLGRSIVMFEKDFKPQEWDGSELLSQHENFLNEKKETSSNTEGPSTPKYYKPISKNESPPGALAKYYRKFGFYWNIFPKTDYTYLPSSPYYGMEVAPGIPVIPNLSRRSIHSRSSFQRTTTAITEVCTTVYKTVKVTVETVTTTFLGTRNTTHESRSPWLRLVILLLFLLPLLYFLFPLDDYHEKSSPLTESKSYLLAPVKYVWSSVSAFTSVLFRAICMIPTLSLQILYLIQSFIASSFEGMSINSSLPGNVRPLPSVMVSYNEKSSTSPTLNKEEIRQIVLAILKEREAQRNEDIDLRFEKVKSSLMNMVTEENSILNMKTQEELRHVIRQGVTNNPPPLDIVKEMVNEIVISREHQREDYIKELIENYLSKAAAEKVDSQPEVERGIDKDEVERLIKTSSLKTLSDVKALFNSLAKHLRMDFLIANEQHKNDVSTLTQEVNDLRSSKLTKEELLKEVAALTSILNILQNKVNSLEEVSLKLHSGKANAVSDHSLSHLHEFVRTAIHKVLSKYHADRTGKPDYALLTNGGYVVSVKCTAYYAVFGSVYFFNWIKSWDLKASPNAILQPGIMPGECWPFEGASGFFVIQLANTIKVEGFTLEHMPKELSIYGNIDSAPNDFSVWAVKSESDPEPMLLGRFQFLDNGESLQYFEALDYPHPVNLVELRVETNHGNLNYTCLYRFRVHGQRWSSTEEETLSKDSLNS